MPSGDDISTISIPDQECIDMYAIGGSLFEKKPGKNFSVMVPLPENICSQLVIKP